MLRVRTVFTGPQGAPWVSTIHGNPGDTVAGAQNLVNAIGTFWGAVDAVMHTSVLWSTEAEVEDINVVTGDTEAVFTTTPATGAGATVTELLPRIAQAVVRFRTGVFVLGKEIRGRIFVPGLTELANTAGALTPATQSTIQSAAAALVADVTAQVGVWSKTHGQFQIPTSTSVWSQFAYLGSRRD